MRKSDLFIKAIENDATAAVELGKLYYNGEYGEENKGKAAVLFMKAFESDESNADACAGLAECCLNGIGTQKDSEKALEWAVRAAACGNSDVLNSIARKLYEEEKPHSRKTIKAFEIWLIAAYAGCPDSMTKAGVCYICGIGTVCNKARGIELLEKAAEKGCAEAYYHIGHCYSEGNGVPENKMKAKEYYRKASEMGYEDADAMIGIISKAEKKEELMPEPEKEEEPVTKDIYSFSITQAKEEKQKDNLALGLEMLEKGNPSGAVFYLELAAAENSAKAKFHLAELFIGENLTDYRRAEKYFLEVIASDEENLHEKARFNLAMLYSSALRNDEKAFVMWRALADEGNVDAQYNCGLCYYNAIGTTKNEDAALLLWQTAAARGHRDAKYNLETVINRRKRKGMAV